MKIDPKQYRAQYEHQDELGGGFAPPPPGTYHVVGTALKRASFGAMKKLAITASVLKHVESKDDAGETSVGKSFDVDFFADWTDKRSVARISMVGLACGHDEAWDPDDDDDAVRVLTGTPFLLKLDHRFYKTGKGDDRVAVQVLEVRALGAAERKAYVAAPDWKKIVGDPAKRVREPYVQESGGQKRENTAPRDASPRDDDIPF